MTGNIIIGFDLDGTLVDSSADIRDCIRDVLKVSGFDPTIADLVKIGPPFKKMLRIVSNLSDASIDLLYGKFRNRYDQSGFPKTRLFPNCRKVLNLLKHEGVKMFLATNKPSSATSNLMEQLELQDFFAAIYTPTFIENRSITKFEMLELASEAFRPRRHMLFVGDSLDDIMASRAINAYSAAAEYGYSDPKTLADARPDYTIRDLSELPAILEQLKSTSIP